MNNINPGVQMGSTTPNLDNAKMGLAVAAILVTVVGLAFVCPLGAAAYVAALLWAL